MNNPQPAAFYSVFPPAYVPSQGQPHRRRRKNRKPKKKEEKKKFKWPFSTLQTAFLLTICSPFIGMGMNLVYAWLTIMTVHGAERAVNGLKGFLQ